MDRRAIRAETQNAEKASERKYSGEEQRYSEGVTTKSTHSTPQVRNKGTQRGAAMIANESTQI